MLTDIDKRFTEDSAQEGQREGFKMETKEDEVVAEVVDTSSDCKLWRRGVDIVDRYVKVYVESAARNYKPDEVTLAMGDKKPDDPLDLVSWQVVRAVLIRREREGEDIGRMRRLLAHVHLHNKQLDQFALFPQERVEAQPAYAADDLVKRDEALARTEERIRKRNEQIRAAESALRAVLPELGLVDGDLGGLGAILLRRILRTFYEDVARQWIETEAGN